MQNYGQCLPFHSMAFLWLGTGEPKRSSILALIVSYVVCKISTWWSATGISGRSCSLTQSVAIGHEVQNLTVFAVYFPPSAMCPKKFGYLWEVP